MRGAWLAALAVLAVSCTAFLIFALRSRGPEDTVFHAFLRALGFLYAKLFHRLSVVATGDPLPPSGGCILASNHRSGLDPVVLSLATKRRIRFLMAREYYEMPLLNWLFRSLGCIPVNRDGKDLRAIQQAIRALREGQVIGIFPQGGIRREGEPESGSPGVALLCLRASVPVVPFWVESNRGSGSVFRSILIPSKTTVRAGKPVDYALEIGKTKPSRDELERVTADILRRIAELGRDEPRART